MSSEQRVAGSEHVGLRRITPSQLLARPSVARDGKGALFFGLAHREIAKGAIGYIYFPRIGNVPELHAAARESGRIEGEQMLAEFRAGVHFAEHRAFMKCNCGLPAEGSP